MSRDTQVLCNGFPRVQSLQLKPRLKQLQELLKGIHLVITTVQPCVRMSNCIP